MSDTYLAVSARTDMNRYNKVRLPAPPFEIPEAQPRITRAAKVPVTGRANDNRGLDATSNNYTKRAPVDQLIANTDDCQRFEAPQ